VGEQIARNDPKGELDQNSGVPQVGVKKDITSAWEFRPLTEEEKKEFQNSLDAEGKRLLEELSRKRKSI
jgi:ClpP class serine protease